jgi:hypothetical protein
MKPYYIFAPERRHNSGGNRVLYKFIAELDKRGHKVFLSAQTGRPKRGEMIVVMPDIYNNDGSLGKIVRWIMYPMSGSRVPRDNEMIFYFNKEIDYKNRGVNRLCLDAIELELFNNKETFDRTIECFYVGKGNNVPRVPATTRLTEITKNFPATRADVAELLKKSRMLYSYDNCSSINDEARLCGCPVCLIPKMVYQILASSIGIGKIGNMNEARKNVGQFEKEYITHVNSIAGDIDNFIAMSQAEFANG